MATCSRCGRKGIFLKLQDGVCENCVSILYAENELTKIEEAKKSVQREISDLAKTLSDKESAFAKLKEDARIAAIQSAQEELNDLSISASIERGALEKTRAELQAVSKELVETRDEVMLQSFGLYEPRYSFKNSDEYKSRLLKIRAEQKDMIKAKTAVSGATEWRVNGSAAQGKKMVSDTQKLLLRAFNAECDDVIEHVKYSNIEPSEKRITSSRDAISKLGNIMSISITPAYYKSKIDELYLAFEYQQKKQQEKEDQKEAKARMREEAKLAKEIEAQRLKLEKEQTHYQNALKKITVQLESASDEECAAIEEKKKQIEEQLSSIDQAFKDVDYRAANQKAGYVYIISNIGAFGENVFKIGMTRRLDPMERVDELGDASVPFNFDVHAMIFSDDAPKLEAALHNAFADRRLNFVNQRREFFNVTIDEIKEVVKKNFDKSVEFVELAPAEQYRQSLLLRKSH